MEAEIVDAWGELFYKGNVSDDDIARGEEILESLRPESPLRRRLGDELTELRRLREEAARKAAAPPPKPKPVPKPAPVAKPASMAPLHSASAVTATAPSVAAVAARPVAKPAPVFAEGNSESTEQLLAKLACGEISIEEASRKMAAAEKRREGLYCRVSMKGAISVYGLQRMPVTLYVEQWERLLNFAEDIRDFAKENSDELKRKA